MFEIEREQMVSSQIIARGIVHPGIIESMRHVPRHEFVDSSLWPSAYEDHPLSIGSGQTISQPYIVAYMLSLAEPSLEKCLLEIGSGCGYLLAVASKLFGQVIGIERIEELYQYSIDILKKLGVSNATIFCNDGYQGSQNDEQKKFDSIIISCSCSHIPPPLLEQLAPGGVLVAPIGDTFLQDLVIVRKDANGALKVSSGGGVRFVPLISSHSSVGKYTQTS